jgi:hypothetical protein
VSKKPTIDGDITNRTIVVFMHPKSKKDNPNLCAISIRDFVEFGPPETRKGKPWIFVSTQIIQ